MRDLHQGLVSRTSAVLIVGIAFALGPTASPADAQLWLPGFFYDEGTSPGHRGEAIAVGDFNGDGFDDLAIGRPRLVAAGVPRVGAVVVRYGGPGVFSVTQILNPDILGDTPVSGDAFGAALAAGDFDADGRDDLAIGVPGRRVDGASGAGALYVLYGSGSLLGDGAVQRFDQLDLEDDPESGDRFGSVLVAGDLSDDGADELVVGVPLEDIAGPLGPRQDAGAIHVIYSIPGFGLVTTGNQLIHENTPGVDLNANADERFGFALAIGQFLAGGVDDLAVGAPGEVVVGPDQQGAVIILRGQPDGLDPAGTEEFVFSQQTDGVLGTGQDGDEFGYALAVGDFDGDRSTDLAIGSPGESELGTTESGAVHVLYGFDDIGLTVGGTQFLVESSFDTDVDPFDRLGAALAAGDFSADGRDDLAIGAPLDNSLGFVNAGEVDVLYGTPQGLVIAGGQVFNMIFFDTLEIGDEFGYALATGRFFSASHASENLVVGVPRRGGPAGDEPGAAIVIRSRSIFADGFDRGDTARWSGASGG